MRPPTEAASYSAIWLFGYLAIWLFGCSARKGAAPLRLRVARRRRDAIDGLTKNTADVVYHSHGSRDGYYGIHPGPAANAVEFVEAQFANIIGHVVPLFRRRDHSLMPGRRVGDEWRSARVADRVTNVTIQNRPLPFSN